MASERNRIIELKEYLSSLGISVNIGKNKARGHKGIFMHRLNDFRIDVSEGVSDENILSVILHEFAHYIHYCYDNTLRSLNFIFCDYTDEIKEELIKITIHEIPKDYASSFYTKKSILNEEIKEIVKNIKKYEPEFKVSEKNKAIEKNITYPFNYLLNYDRVRFGSKLFSIDRLNDYSLGEKEIYYILLKSKQRAVKRINAKISRINRYYNNPTELFARFIDSYYTKPEYTKKTAPIAYSVIAKSKNPYIEKLNNIFE